MGFSQHGSMSSISLTASSSHQRRGPAKTQTMFVRPHGYLANQLSYLFPGAWSECFFSLDRGSGLVTERDAAQQVH